MSEQNDIERPEPLRLRQTGSISELAKALAVAQGQVVDAIKDSENSHYKSSYADLASVWHACRSALASNGLSVIQAPSYTKQHVLVTTRLLHSSGEWFEGTLAIPVGRADAHGIGSAITYGRRYSLAAMVGVAPDEDDDDGNAAVRAKERAKAEAVKASGGRIKPASELHQPAPEPARGDDPNWEQWLTPPADVEASEEPHVWYCQAIKGLLAHCGARNIGHVRAVLAWLYPGDEQLDPTVVKTDPGLAQAVWAKLCDKSNEVPFTRIVGEAIRAQKAAEESQTP